MRPSSAILALVAGVLISGCVKPSAARDSLMLAPRVAQQELARGSDVISRTEIGSHPELMSGNAYDLVRILRPALLSVQTPAGAAESPLVLVDGVERGRLEVLQLIPARVVSEIQLVHPVDAMARYGREYGSGVLVVTTLR